MKKFDMNTIMSMLSKMDSKDLEAGLEQANKLLQSKSKDEIIKGLNNNEKQN